MGPAPPPDLGPPTSTSVSPSGTRVKGGLPAWLWLFFGLLVAFGIGLIVVGTVHTPPAKRNDLWSEVAKSGIQLIGVTLIGLLVTVVLKSVDERRARKQRYDQLRLDILREILVCYAQVKGVRREFRAIGLRPPNEHVAPLKDEAVKAWREQMALLIKTQLEIETITRHLDQRQLFVNNATIVSELRAVEQYLNEGIGECDLGRCDGRHGRVIAEWEKIGWKVRDSVDRETLKEFKHLRAFIGNTDESFDPMVAKKLDDIIKVVHKEVYGETTAEGAGSRESLMERLTP